MPDGDDDEKEKCDSGKIVFGFDFNHIEYAYVLSSRCVCVKNPPSYHQHHPIFR